MKSLRDLLLPVMFTGILSLTSCVLSNSEITPETDVSYQLKMSQKLRRLVDWQKDINSRLRKISLYHYLKDQPDVLISVYPDTTLLDNRLVGVSSGSGNKEFFKGVVKIVPFDKLREEMKENYDHKLFHEVFHLLQDYIFWKHIQGKERTENARFILYSVKVPVDSTDLDIGYVKHVYPGKEVEAYCYTALKEYGERGEIDDHTLSAFYYYIVLMVESGEYKDNEGVRGLIGAFHEKIKKVTGYTIKTFYEEKKEKLNIK